MKYLRVTMPDGSRWDVPAEVIAKNKAERCGAGQDMVRDTLRDENELRDWAANNMNWTDVQSVAKKAEIIPMPQADYQDGWINGHKEILDY